MATENLHNDEKPPLKLHKVAPRQQPGRLPTEGAGATARAVRAEAVARSHNTFRPDIYRVSEGYLN